MVVNMNVPALMLKEECFLAGIGKDFCICFSLVNDIKAKNKTINTVSSLSNSLVLTVSLDWNQHKNEKYILPLNNDAQDVDNLDMPKKSC